MTIHVEERPAAEDTAPVPYLIDRGLAEACPDCPTALTLAEQLNRRAAKVTLTAECAWTQDGTCRHEDVPIGGKLTVTCKRCYGSGVIPTRKGWVVIAFVKTFLADCVLGQLDQVEEIPF